MLPERALKLNVGDLVRKFDYGFTGIGPRIELIGEVVKVEHCQKPMFFKNKLVYITINWHCGFQETIKSVAMQHIDAEEEVKAMQ